MWYYHVNLCKKNCVVFESNHYFVIFSNLFTIPCGCEIQSESIDKGKVLKMMIMIKFFFDKSRYTCISSSKYVKLNDAPINLWKIR